MSRSESRAGVSVQQQVPSYIRNIAAPPLPLRLAIIIFIFYTIGFFRALISDTGTAVSRAQYPVSPQRENRRKVGVVMLERCPQWLSVLQQ